MRYSFLVLLAVFSTTDARAAAPLHEQIDGHIRAAWQRESITPAGPATDAEFLRRVYLDLAGTIPTADEAAAFLDDPNPAKRAKLVDRLLADPRFAAHQADVWDMVLFGRNPPGYGTDKRDGFRDWLRRQLAENAPYNEWARAILRAEGNTVEHGPPMYFVQYSRRPEDAAEAVTQTFLGIQLQCARCHDHPFEDWSQKDFYGVAAFFARLESVNVGKKDGETAYAIGEKSSGDVLFTGPASEQMPGQKGEPIKPKFLLGEALKEPPLPEDFKEVRFESNKMPPDPKFSRKDAFADWATDAESPYFARAVANRVWAQFMGRGLVHPVDDMSPYNPPSHPELLDLLTTELVAHGFDLKWYIRELCLSETYQLSGTGPVEAARPRWHERARVRPLSAEELLAAWRVAVGYDAMLAASGKEPKDRYEPVGSGYLLSFLGKPTDGTGEFQGGLREHLYLNNGGLSKLLITQEGSLFHEISKSLSETPWPQRVDRLFLATLSRRPTDAEREHFVAHLAAEDDVRERLLEAIWALITCSEFRFNH